MKFTSIFLAGVFASGLWAAEVGTDGKAPAEPAAVQERELSRAGLRRVRALENYIAAMRNPADSPERARKLLAALDADPAAPAILQGLAESIGDDVEKARTYAPELNRISGARPRLLELAVFAARIDRMAGNPAEARLDRLAASLESVSAFTGLSEPEQNAWCALFGEASGAALAVADYVRGDALAKRAMELAGSDVRVSGVAGHFYYLAAFRAPRERRWLGLRQSEAAEYAETRKEVEAKIAAGDDALHTSAELLSRFSYYASVGKEREAFRMVQRLNAGAFSFEHRALLVDWAIRIGDRAAFDKAEAEIREEVKVPQVQPYLLTARFRMLQRAKAWKEAEAQLAKFTKPVEAWQFRLSLLQAEGKFDAFKSLLKTPPKGAEIPFAEVAVAAEKSRDPELLEMARAFAVKSKLLETPDFANTIGYISAELNLDLPEAERLIRLAVAAHPDNPAYLDSLGWVLYRQKRYQEADDAFRNAERYVVPHDGGSVIYDHAGDAARMVGDVSRARHCYRVALEVARPDDDLDAAATRKKLEELR